MFRVVLAGVTLLFCASNLSAQITTYVAPPRQLQPSPQTVAVADSMRRDSVNQVAMRNMKEWVDSAAGVSVPARDTATVAVVQPNRTVTTTFSNGSVAPETASDLPALALVGFIGLVVGAGLLAQKPRG
ncbi:MAG TPA: hypothetical protein VJ867_17820 [Gemmatimonadaceae bacterium]|nr:hypothetical protein [Gemmatimonadaceae bacterium]